jgi:hypothetical protein
VKRNEVDVPDALRTRRRLTTALLVVMVTQASLGLLFPGAYRDVEWINATWFGNDLVTLLVAVPLLFRALALLERGSVRGLLLWLGMLGFAAYNYAFYLFGAALNAFFLIYVVALVLALVLLILAFSSIDAREIADRFHETVPARLIGGLLVFIGTGLAFVWTAMWAAYVFAGRPTPLEPDAFRLVAALDLSFMVPTLIVGGVLLWLQEPWGFVTATIASILGALYLFVLSVNSVVAIQRGLTDAPGELPVWATLTLLMSVSALMLLANIRRAAGHVHFRRLWISVRATTDERARALPGDERISQAIDTLTHGVTIRRPPADVWPWLVQMGAGSRGGWYSYDWLDNGRQRSAARVVPELQHPAIGTIFPALPGMTDGFTVLAIEHERVLTLGWLAPDGTPEVTWTFVLEEMAPAVTRLLVRVRGGPGYRFYRLPLPLTRIVIRVVHFIMQRKQLLGIKHRAEATPPRARADVDWRMRRSSYS